MYICIQPAFLGSFGGPELIIIFVVVLILFGPKRLPEIAKMFGKTAETLRKSAQDFKSEVMKIEHEDTTPKPSKTDIAPVGAPSMEEQGYIDVDGVMTSDKPEDNPEPGSPAAAPDSDADPAPEEQEMADAVARTSETGEPVPADQPGVETESRTDDHAG